MYLLQACEGMYLTCGVHDEAQHEVFHMKGLVRASLPQDLQQHCCALLHHRVHVPAPQSGHATEGLYIQYKSDSK